MDKLAALGQRGPAHKTHVAFHQVTLDMKAELHRAIKKHGLNNTPASPSTPQGVSFVVLVEEMGEAAEQAMAAALMVKAGDIARAMTYDEGSTDKLEAELIQVATMAAAWVVGIRQRLQTTEGV